MGTDQANKKKNHTNKNAYHRDPQPSKKKKRDEEKQGNHGCDPVLRLSLALKLQRRKMDPEKERENGKIKLINVRPLA